MAKKKIDKNNYHTAFVVVGVIGIFLFILFLIAFIQAIHYYGEYKYQKAKADYFENKSKETYEWKIEKIYDEENCWEITCECAKNTTTPCMAYCYECKEEIKLKTKVNIECKSCVTKNCTWNTTGKTC